jgi:hypothetical protein
MMMLSERDSEMAPIADGAWRAPINTSRDAA